MFFQKNLIELIFGNNFDQSLFNTETMSVCHIFPNSLTKLIFGNNINQKYMRIFYQKNLMNLLFEGWITNHLKKYTNIISIK